jgi:hypothetical protein
MIVFDLAQLIYYAVFFAKFGHKSFGYQSESYVKNLQDLIEEEHLDPVISVFNRPTLQGLRAFVQSMSDDEVLKVIQKEVFVPYLSRLFSNGVVVCSVHKARKQFVEATKPELLEVPKTARDKNPFNFVTHVTREWIGAFTTLRRSFEVALDLRTHVREAIAHHELDRESMSALKLKMKALNDHFYDASLLLGHDPPQHNLVWDGDQWW